MDKLYCTINDPDRLSNELLKNFIEKTDSLCIADEQNGSPVDIVFIDSDLDKRNFSKEEICGAHIVIVSSNKKYINSLFKDEIADFLYKPDLNYSRFLKSIEVVRSK
jgi:hypothetical protein